MRNEALLSDIEGVPCRGAGQCGVPGRSRPGRKSRTRRSSEAPGARGVHALQHRHLVRTEPGPRWCTDGHDIRRRGAEADDHVRIARRGFVSQMKMPKV
jgi:hypothetical protein